MLQFPRPSVMAAAAEGQSQCLEAGYALTVPVRSPEVLPTAERRL